MSKLSSAIVACAFKAIAMGWRPPESKRLSSLVQHSRTMEAIRRQRIDAVLDVGANRGFYAKHLRMGGYRGPILSFEPEPSAFAHLSRAAAGDPGWRVFNFALGDADGHLGFNVVRFGEGGQTVLSSLLTPAEGAGSGSGFWDRTARSVIEVEVRRLRDLLPDLLPTGSRVFLKMDTQGYDLKVFEGADLTDIRLIQSEVSVVPLYEGMPHYTEALLTYEMAGFSLIDAFVVNRTPQGGVLEYDVLLGRL